MNIIKSLVLFYNSKHESVAKYAEKLKLRLGISDVQKICVSSGSGGYKIKPAAGAIALGGDGTVLYAARSICNLGIPLLGINAGSLGFLSAVSQSACEPVLADFLAGNLLCEERMMLQSSVFRGGKLVFGPALALNDCIIRALENRAFGLSTEYNGRFLSECFGDGLIISAPSGASAYNLAAGGPLVMPAQELFILSPICPHALTQSVSIILPASGMLSASLSGHIDKRQLYTLTMDGQINFELKFGDIVQISAAPKKLKLLLPKGYDYFKVLRAKLHWGERIAI